MLVQPYLSFDGRCDEASGFYARAIGAETTMLMRFKDSPEPSMSPPGAENKVMHMSMRIGDSVVMASDGGCREHASFQGFSLALTAADDTDAARKFAALADGGQVEMPLAKTFFASSFGMLVDRFGVRWMILAEAK